MKLCFYTHISPMLVLEILKNNNDNQVSYSFLAILSRTPHPMDSCGGSPVGIWENVQDNLMKKPAVIGS